MGFQIVDPFDKQVVVTFDERTDNQVMKLLAQAQKTFQAWIGGATVRSTLKRVIPVLVAAALLIGAAPTAAAADNHVPQALWTVTAAPPKGSLGNESCITAGTATKCVEPGDAEITTSVPAKMFSLHPGPDGAYGPFFAD